MSAQPQAQQNKMPTPEAIAWADQMIMSLRDNPDARLALTENHAQRLAKILRRVNGVPLFAARNMVAVLIGFTSWGEAYRFVCSNDKTTQLQVKRQRKHVALIRRRKRATRRFFSRVKTANSRHDRAWLTAVPRRSIRTALAMLKVGDIPVDRVAVRVVFNRDPKDGRAS